jgi:hypothetical protein
VHSVHLRGVYVMSSTLNPLYLKLSQHIAVVVVWCKLYERCRFKQRTFDAPLYVLMLLLRLVQPALATAALLRPAGHPLALTVLAVAVVVISSPSSPLLLLLLPPTSTSKCDSAAAAFDLTVGALSPHLCVHGVVIVHADCIYMMSMYGVTRQITQCMCNVATVVAIVRCLH